MTVDTVFPAIIIPCMRRPISLHRLLSSINNATFDSASNVNLVISIDGGGEPEVERVARSFAFKHGAKEILVRDSRLGLKNHLLWAGDQSMRFGSVIVLEEDLMVDRNFYSYAVQAIQCYKNNDSIAGIALYSPRYHFFSDLPFEPKRTDYDGYFMQMSCSWGQAWTAEQWREFRRWIEGKSDQDVLNCSGLPRLVANWPASSWLKFHSAYVVETGRYFFYPYMSYTTNCADSGGEHVLTGTDLFQVPLASYAGAQKQLKFPSFNEKAVLYDAFMEYCGPSPIPGYDMVQFDIHAVKPLSLLDKQTLVITSRPTKKAVQKYPLRFKPVEVNVLQPLEPASPAGLYLTRVEDIQDEGKVGAFMRWARLAQYYSNLPLYSERFIFVVCVFVWRRFIVMFRSFCRRIIRRSGEGL